MVMEVGTGRGRESQDHKSNECPAQIFLTGSRELDWEGNPFQIATSFDTLSVCQTPQSQRGHDTWAAPYDSI